MDYLFTDFMSMPTPYGDRRPQSKFYFSNKFSLMRQLVLVGASLGKLVYEKTSMNRRGGAPSGAAATIIRRSKVILFLSVFRKLVIKKKEKEKRNDIR